MPCRLADFLRELSEQSKFAFIHTHVFAFKHDERQGTSATNARPVRTLGAKLTGHVLQAQVEDTVPVPGTGPMEREERSRAPLRRRHLLLHLLEPSLSLGRAWHFEVEIKSNSNSNHGAAGGWV